VTTGELLTRLEGVKKSGHNFAARCPAHKDKHQSLSVGDGDQGVVVHCHAGCTVDEVTAALGLEVKDLFYEEAGSKEETPDAVYTYQDKDGKPVYEVVRMPGKRFFQRALSDEGPVYSMKGVDRVLYRLPEVLEAVGNRKVFVVEGEKDVEAIRRAEGVATCSAGGAQSWQPSFSDVLHGAHVIVVADKDDAGRQYAQEVADSLEGKAASITMVEAKAGKDAHDHLSAGYGLGDFVPVGEEVYDGIELTRSDLVQVRDVEWVPGYENMIAYGAISLLMGMPGVNKSTWSCQVASAVTRLGQAALLLSTEDSPSRVMRPRLEATGARLELCYFVTKKVEGAEGMVFLPSDITMLERAVAKSAARLVVVDPIQAHFEGGNDGNNDPMIRSALAPLAKMAERNNCAVLLLMHLNKTRSQSPMLRAGGSIGIPGVSRTCLLMAEHPDEPEELARRVVAGFKNNWGPLPASRDYYVENVALPDNHYSIRLVEFGETHHKAHDLLSERKKEAAA
jgi:5S rRNA maturation endonuclease (ribonuclease M5)